ncbi:MAG: helix-turn-helix domain-containing protein [Agrococcus sp.]
MDSFITPYTDLTSLGAGVLLTQEDVATMCRVKPDTVKRWRMAGTGPRFLAPGKTPLYRAGDLAAWLEHSRADA